MTGTKSPCIRSIHAISSFIIARIIYRSCGSSIFSASGLFLPLFAEISLFYLIIVHKLLCVSAESN
ncbi:hypothetical protein, partial [Enterocloster sp.]|uniref:hypothetical protein n=1 Tax=Enterocloster sp. TaxID=2719315 RepID=UPI0039A0144D